MACSVEEEHEQVSRELDRLPRQADMEARVANLNRQLEDLRDEIRKVCLLPVSGCFVICHFSAFERHPSLHCGGGEQGEKAGLHLAGRQ